LDEAIGRVRPEGSFDMVSLLIGVNNQYRGRSEKEYRTEFSRLLQRAIGLAGDNPQRVIVLSIPDWGVTPFANGRDRAKIAGEIDSFNSIKREETVKSGAHFIDVTPISREATNAPSLIASDGLHPSAEMYAGWAKLVSPVAASILVAQHQPE
jgi:lysophospholipase L1-like esterase